MINVPRTSQNKEDVSKFRRRLGQNKEDVFGPAQISRTSQTDKGLRPPSYSKDVSNRKRSTNRKRSSAPPHIIRRTSQFPWTSLSLDSSHPDAQRVSSLLFLICCLLDVLFEIFSMFQVESVVVILLNDLICWEFGFLVCLDL